MILPGATHIIQIKILQTPVKGRFIRNEQCLRECDPGQSVLLGRVGRERVEGVLNVGRCSWKGAEFEHSWLPETWVSGKKATLAWCFFLP